MTGDHGALGHLEGGQSHGDAADQHQVEDVGADDVAQGQVAVALHQGGDGGDQLRQAGAQGHEGQGDDGFGHPQRSGDLGAVVHQQLRAHGNQRRADHQKEEHLPGGHLLHRFLGRLGVLLHLTDGQQYVGHKNNQHDQTDEAAELAQQIGRHAVDGRSQEEEQDRQLQRLGIRLAGPHCQGDGGDQGGVADHRADGVAVGDLAVAAHRGDGGDHDLGQGGADGHHRGADQQLGQVEFAGQGAGPVHEPVAALDQTDQADDKQQYGNKHSDSSNFFVRISGSSAEKARPSPPGADALRKRQRSRLFVPAPGPENRTDGDGSVQKTLATPQCRGYYIRFQKSCQGFFQLTSDR